MPFDMPNTMTPNVSASASTCQPTLPKSTASPPKYVAVSVTAMTSPVMLANRYFSSQPTTTGVPDGQRQRAEHGDGAQDLARAAAFLAEAHDHGLRERADRAFLRHAAERHLARDAGEAEHHHEHHERNQERRAAELGDAIREQPDAADAHSGSDARNDERGPCS